MSNVPRVLLPSTLVPSGINDDVELGAGSDLTSNVAVFPPISPRLMARLRICLRSRNTINTTAPAAIKAIRTRESMNRL